MFDMIKKTMLAGIGFAALTKDKVEQLIKEYIERGEITEKEGKKLLNEFMKKYEQSQKDMEAKLDRRVQRALKKKNIATLEHIAGLEKRLTRLEKRKPAVKR
jgi:polyhydroxyalkanoate synthesis regulator phasin